MRYTAITTMCQFIIMTQPHSHKTISPDDFITQKIHIQSESELIGALRNLARDSETFRGVLNSFYNEQPRVTLLLTTTARPTFGDIKIHKTQYGYVLVLHVQEIPSAKKMDHIEPWLGSMIFLALEVSRNANSVRSSEIETDYTFSENSIKSMWKFQKVIRSEISRSNPQFYQNLNNDPSYLYRHAVLGR